MDDTIKIENIDDMERIVEKLPDATKYIAVYIADYEEKKW